jgi:hypothetical protein
VVLPRAGSVDVFVQAIEQACAGGSVEVVEQLDKGAGELRLGDELDLVGARAQELGQGLGVGQALYAVS